ncbi:MAG: 6-phosphogluconolactonase [Thermaerobacter sp.]|nr:6-phosphogluconolactonase [Thermaerobacter sp.]
MSMRLDVSATPEQALARCASAIAQALAAAAQPSLCLAGGTTPRGAYAMLAADYENALDWHRVGYWFGDERCVAPTHPKSNYRMALDSLLDPLGVPSHQVHRMLAELGAQEGARRYAQRLTDRLGARPVFTVALLGMGQEGHTASLFPGSPALQAGELVVGVDVPAVPRERITLTPAALSAEHVFLLVTGEQKRDALAAAVAAKAPDPHLPTSYVRGSIETVCFCDAAAAPADS